MVNRLMIYYAVFEDFFLLHIFELSNNKFHCFQHMLAMCKSKISFCVPFNYSEILLS